MVAGVDRIATARTMLGPTSATVVLVGIPTELFS
jgi:hypothetical protein